MEMRAARSTQCLAPVAGYVAIEGARSLYLLIFNYLGSLRASRCERGVALRDRPEAKPVAFLPADEVTEDGRQPAG